MKGTPYIAVAIVFLLSCSTGNKLRKLESEGSHAGISLPNDVAVRQTDNPAIKSEVTLVGLDNERHSLVMNAARDESGELVAQDEIAPVIKIETFRNVAERGGTVDIKFNITAPASILDSRWQVRFSPMLIFEDDSMPLERIYVTGEEFRRKQKQGYERYERYLSGIIDDPSEFVWKRELGIFLSRSGNYSERYRNVAVDHYTDKVRKGLNDRKILRKDEVFEKVVREPFCSSGLRLDTVCVESSGDMTYEYVQSLTLSPTVKKFKLTMTADIHGIGEKLYALPRSGPLTFYVSSLSTLAVDVPERDGDSLYVRALDHLRNRRYRMAIADLAPYADFNAALAYTALNYNRKALDVLSVLERQPKVEYLTALLLCRTGEEIKALDCYQKACAVDRSFIYRGNLDPEIRNLKNKYKLID